MKKIIALCSVAILALPILVNAQDSSISAEVLNQMQNEGSTASPINETVIPTREVNRPAVVPNRQNAVQNRQNNIQERQVNMQERRTATALRFAEVKERVEGKKADIAQRLAERKLNVDERRTRLQENVKKRVGALAENVYARLTAVLQKLNQLSDRLENKISELETAGSDIGDARTLLDSAKGKLIEVGAELEASKATFESLLEDEVSKGDVRSLIEPIKNSLKEAHAELVKVVTEIKN